MTSQSSDHHHKYHDEGREIEVQSGWPRNIFLAYHQSPPQGDFEKPAQDLELSHAMENRGEKNGRLVKESYFCRGCCWIFL